MLYPKFFPKLNAEFLTVALFSGLSVVVGLAGNRLLTQFVEPGSLGDLYLYMNLAQWLLVPTAASYVFVVRHWQVAQKYGAAHRFTRAIFRGLGFQMAIVAVGATAFAALHLDGLTATGGLLLVLVCAGLALNQIFDSVQSLERRRVSAGLLGLFSSPLRPFALMLAALLWARATGGRLLLVQAVYSCLTAAASLAFLLPVLKSSPEAAEKTPLAKVSPQLSRGAFFSYLFSGLGAAFTNQVGSSTERWGLALAANSAATAIFVQAGGLATAVVGAASAFLNTYYQPLITGAAAQDETRPLEAAAPQLRSYLGLTAMVLAATGIAFALLAGPVTTALFGPKYAAVRPLLPWTMLGASCFQMAQAIAFVPIASRTVLRLNGVIVVSRILYVTLLVLFGAGAMPALRFARLYAAGHAIYLAMMIVLALYLRRAERRTPRDPRVVYPGAMPSGANPEDPA